MSDNAQLSGLCDRFRGFYPVVIDVETAGFNAKTDALLEIAAITLKMDEQGWLMPDTTLHFHVEPFEGANLQPEALAFNGIDPNNPLRGAVSEYDALHAIFKMVRKGIKDSGCNRAIMVAHNATFDHSFMMAAAERASLKRNPFHPFVTFDTAALSGLSLKKRPFQVAFLLLLILLSVRLFGFVFRSCFFNQLLQLTALVHFDQNVTTANQLTINPQLWESWPVCVFRQFGANIRVLQNINVSKAFTTG